MTKLVPFGAFVEVDDAIEGLVHISELAEHHVEKAEDEVKVHDRVPVTIIDIDLDRRRISLSRKQAIRLERGVETAPERPDMELEEGEADAEIAVEAASEAVGVPTEDPSLRPETEEELLSAAESAPEVTAEVAAPEAGVTPDVAAAVAPPEEKEEAAVTALMATDTPPEGREGVTAAEPDKPNIDVRLNQEEPDPEAAPGETLPKVEAEIEAEGEPVLGSDEVKKVPEELDPDDTREESLESIVEDLKRERGQS